MPTAHLYIFSDASPSDWLNDGADNKWHTIANFVFQSDPALQNLIDKETPFEEILLKDSLFTGLRNSIQSHALPSSQLRKWNTGPGYRSRFSKAFSSVVGEYHPLVSAVSFQEKTLRQSKQALLNSYNHLVGGIEGRGIGFEEFLDDKGRKQMKHSFVNFFGYHEIQCPENQMLVLLLMAWFIADQYTFCRKEIVDSEKLGFDNLALTVVSDKLSGDDDFRSRAEEVLRNLIDPDGAGTPIKLTRSPKSDVFFGDLLVDNLAGWLNAAISEEASEFTKALVALDKTGVWKGWHELRPSVSLLESSPAISRLTLTEKA